MSERFFFYIFAQDKTITNPINKSEIFLCSDLYHDYLKCRAMYNKGLKSKSMCRDIRNLAQKCYLNTEEDFEKILLKTFEEKRKYVSYLEKEGSLLYYHYKSDPTVFSVKKVDVENTDLTPELNEFISKYK